MSLIKLCNPIFQYICFLKRDADNMAEVSYEEAKNTILSKLNNIQNNLKRETRLWRQYTSVKLSLLFFIDSIICESELTFSNEWDKNRLAYQEGELTGDMKFFESLELLLAEYTKDSDECLKLYYIFLGLGFSGAYSGSPEILEEFMDKIKKRLNYIAENKKTECVSSNALKNIDDRYLIRNNYFTGKNLTVFAILLFLIWFVFNTILFYNTAGNLQDNLEKVNSTLQLNNTKGEKCLLH
jgi:type IV/VI secretion system ImpK/VasF family protein